MRTLPFYDAEASLAARKPCDRLAEGQCEPCPSPTPKRLWLPGNLVAVWRKHNLYRLPVKAVTAEYTVYPNSIKPYDHYLQAAVEFRVSWRKGSERAMRTLPFLDAEASLAARKPCDRLAERHCDLCPSTTLKRRWLPGNLVVVWRKGSRKRGCVKFRTSPSILITQQKLP